MLQLIMTFSTPNDYTNDSDVYDPSLQQLSPGGAGVLGEVLSRLQGVPVPDAATLAGVHTTAPPEEPVLWAATA